MRDRSEQLDDGNNQRNNKNIGMEKHPELYCTQTNELINCNTMQHKWFKYEKKS